MGESFRALLSEGLDLCVRARKLDAMVRTASIAEAGVTDLDRYAERHNIQWPDQPVLTKSGSPALWVSEQYDTDLDDWERRVRKALTTKQEDV